ncbi:hypothetical protein BGX34_004650, partial [Mortierella sp. NVP85]
QELACIGRDKTPKLQYLSWLEDNPMDRNIEERDSEKAITEMENFLKPLDLAEDHCGLISIMMNCELNRGDEG